jgi:hypothetical protein
MDTIEFSCNIVAHNTTDIPLNVTALLNGKEQSSVYVTDTSRITMLIPDTINTTHTIDLVISGKTDSHTTIDNEGNFVSSTMLLIKDFEIDEVCIDQYIVMPKSLPYKHNYNGHGDEVIDQFHDYAGFNGTITLEFDTPFYVWLLNNMWVTDQTQS